MTPILIHLFLHLLLLLLHSGVEVAAQDKCLPTRCGDFGPLIRFPFRLKNRQPSDCGYPGFELSCTSDNITQFMLPFPLWASTKSIDISLSTNVSVREIDYKSQKIEVSDFNPLCLPRQLQNISASASPFTTIPQDSYGGFTLFNCSSDKAYANAIPYDRIACLSGPHYDVLALASSMSISFLPSSCKYMYNISYIPNEVLLGKRELSHQPQILLHWSEPFCGKCEAAGNYCKLKSNGSGSETECVDSPEEPSKGLSKEVIVASVLGGVSAFVAVYGLVKLKIKKEDQKRVERFLEDYKALRPTRYSYADIKKITKQFKYKLGQGGYGKVYTGKLSNEILVAVKVLNNFKGDGADFINEVGSIGRIHHVNVVRLVGYCADGYRRALVYEYLPNDTLQKIISSGNGNASLGWEKMQQIAVGIAKGIEYLHQGCNQRIVHFDIKPHNILLDQDFNPKVADFGLAKLCSKDQSAVSMTAARGTIGYIAPEVFSRNYGNVSYKADIYSFGMLLLDMIGGRKKFEVANEQNDISEIYYPEWMYKQLEKGEEIEIQIEDEDDSSIIKKLAIVGLWCI